MLFILIINGRWSAWSLSPKELAWSGWPSKAYHSSLQISYTKPLPLFWIAANAMIGSPSSVAPLCVSVTAFIGQRPEQTLSFRPRSGLSRDRLLRTCRDQRQKKTWPISHICPSQYCVELLCVGSSSNSSFRMYWALAFLSSLLYFIRYGSTS